MTTPRITLELNAGGRLNGGHQPTWASHVSKLAHPDRHIFIAASKTSHSAKEPTKPLPESVKPLLRDEYLRSITEHPEHATGKVPWVFNESFPLKRNTYAIATPPHSLPFKDGTVNRVVAYNWVADAFNDAANEDVEAKRMKLEEALTDSFKEVHRVLPKRGVFEVHEDTLHHSSLSQALGELFHFQFTGGKIKQAARGTRFGEIHELLENNFIIRHHSKPIPVVEGGGRTHWFELVKRR